ncbi:MAG: DUF4190 domain-containing protein [Jatrophihabitantaceae bacterium]
MSGFAIASAVVGILWIFGVGAIAAVVTGHLALRSIKRSDGRLTGRVGARLGLVLGYLGIVGLIMFVVEIVVRPI